MSCSEQRRRRRLMTRHSLKALQFCRAGYWEVNHQHPADALFNVGAQCWAGRRTRRDLKPWEWVGHWRRSII
jgi:hypothetical protein